MKIKISIDCNNDSFRDDPVAEVSQILRDLILRLASVGLGSKEKVSLYDTNGNNVGSIVTTK